MNNILLDLNILYSQIKFFKLLILCLLLCAGILMGCGSNGDGNSGNKIKSKEGAEEILPPIDSTEGLKWDAIGGIGVGLVEVYEFYHNTMPENRGRSY